MARRPGKRVAKRTQGKQSGSARRANPAPSPPPQRRHNLPTQLTSFIGREREVAEIKRLLGTTRLLTLAGAGGCGKTRLALRVGGELLGEFPDGVWLIELTPLSDPAFVPQAIATTLGISEQSGLSIQDTLTGALRPRTLLLLLDNCEHVRVACADLANALLRECSDLRILATSREPLGISGEIRWTVPSLSIPDLHAPPSPAQLMRYDAVRLFVDRAVAAQSTFVLTESNARAVGSLCQQLDGIPLAIEMAAPWVRALAVEEILTRLSHRFELLASESRTALPRHQTLKATMDWSYELLSEPERILLARLSVFAGGWTLEAAEAVCSGRDVERSRILALLTHLVDKSLAVADTGGGEGRYRLLETVRQYGRDRLLESGEAAELQERHRDWYMSLAERAEPELRGPAQAAWLERLEAELDNLRVALERCKTRGDGDEWLRLAAALHQFWFMRGHLSEGREWLDGALSIAKDAPASVRASALCGAGMLAWRQGDPKGGTLLQESLTLFRTLEDTFGTAHVLHHVAHVLIGQGEYRQASDVFQESVALFNEIGNVWGVGWSLYCLGDVMLKQGDEKRATAVLEESLALCRQAGNTWTTANALGSLGLAAEKRGDYDTAAALLEEGVAIAQQLGAKFHVAWLQCVLANVSLTQGKVERAFILYRESLLRRREIGDIPGLADCLDGLADVASVQRDYLRAARLLAAAKMLRERSGHKRSPRDAVEHDRRVATTHDALGSSTFAAAQSAGRAMTLEQAVEAALTYPIPLRLERKEPVASSLGKRTGLLAPREREVAALIANGKTNREIAASLSITDSTAATHVQHILNKLGVSTRAQIAAWAVAHGLAPGSPSASVSPIDS